MDSPSYVALSRLTGLRRQMDVIANNMANVNTPGFQRENLIFKEFLKDTADPAAGGLGQLSLTQDFATVRDLSEGALVATENPLDLAIRGKGYFVVATDDGERYTRRGTFSLDEQGRLVTRSGLPVIGENGDFIVFPPETSDIQINSDGTVTLRDANDPLAEEVIGRIQVVEFEDEFALQREAYGLLSADEEAPMAAANTEVLQGVIEQSNVNGILEMTNMIQTLQNYNAANTLVEQEHERQRKAIQIVGAPRASA